MSNNALGGIVDSKKNVFANTITAKRLRIAKVGPVNYQKGLVVDTGLNLDQHGICKAYLNEWIKTDEEYTLDGSVWERYFESSGSGPLLLKQQDENNEDVQNLFTVPDTIYYNSQLQADGEYGTWKMIVEVHLNLLMLPLFFNNYYYFDFPSIRILVNGNSVSTFSINDGNNTMEYFWEESPSTFTFHDIIRCNPKDTINIQFVPPYDNDGGVWIFPGPDVSHVTFKVLGFERYIND